MRAPRGNVLRGAARNPRVSLTIAAAAAVSLAATTTVTTAAWVDNEWVGGGVGVASPGDCSTNTLFSGEASATQLSGNVLGIDLKSIAGVEGLRVTNSDGTALPLPVTASQVTDVPDAFISKLPVTALGLNPVTVGLGLGLPVGDLGTYTQWAQAQDSGQTRAAAGLITDQSGAVQVGASGIERREGPSAAKIALDEILPGSLAGVTLDVGAVASSAYVQGCEMVNGWPTLATNPLDVRDYGIASLDLGADVPADRLVVAPTKGVIDILPATIGALEKTFVDELNTEVRSVLGKLGLAQTTSSATVDRLDLAPVHALLSKTLAEGAVTLDLETGRLTIDLAKLPVVAPLSKRMPNQSVLTSEALNQVRRDIGAVLEQITRELRTALDGVQVSAVIPVPVVLGLVSVTAVGSVAEFRTHSPKLTGGVLGLDLTLLDGIRSAVQTAVDLSVVGPIDDVVSDLEETLVADSAELQAPIDAVGALVSIHVNVQPDQPWTGVKPADVAARPGEYKVSAIRVGLINQPGLLSISLGTSAAGPVNYRPS